jgi:hypothetical protein
VGARAADAPQVPLLRSGPPRRRRVESLPAQERDGRCACGPETADVRCAGPAQQRVKRYAAPPGRRPQAAVGLADRAPPAPQEVNPPHRTVAGRRRPAARAAAAPAARPSAGRRTPTATPRVRRRGPPTTRESDPGRPRCAARTSSSRANGTRASGVQHHGGGQVVRRPRQVDRAAGRRRHRGTVHDEGVDLADTDSCREGPRGSRVPCAQGGRGRRRAGSRAQEARGCWRSRGRPLRSSVRPSAAGRPVPPVGSMPAQSPCSRFPASRSTPGGRRPARTAPAPPTTRHADASSAAGAGAGRV